MNMKAGIGETVVHQTIGLADGGLLRIEDGHGLLVEALEGSVWLSQQDEGCDVDIREHQSFRLDRNGTAILSARGGGGVRLSAPAGQRPAKRIVAWRAAGSQPVVVYQAIAPGPDPLGALADWWRKHASRWLASVGRPRSAAR